MIERQTIVVLAAKGRYTRKPRPWVVLQSNDFRAVRSVVVCAFTHAQTSGVPMLRIDVPPSDENGLRIPSQLQVEKVVAVDRTDIASEIGRLEDCYMRVLEQALREVLDL